MSRRIRFIITALMMAWDASCAMAIGLVLEKDFEASANAVIRTVVPNAYEYEYTLCNSRGSNQSIVRWCIPLFGINDSDVVFGVRAPQGKPPSAVSGPSKYMSHSSVMWLIMDRGNPGNSDEVMPPRGVLMPGAKMDGFGFTSVYPPAIGGFYSWGWVRDMTESEILDKCRTAMGISYDNMDEVPDAVFRSIFEVNTYKRAFEGKTLVPMLFPDDQMKPLPLLTRLIGQKEEAASLGWIHPPGIAWSLDQKLENARKALEKGQEKAAAGILGAFLLELEALKEGKHLDDNAYYLLKVNAEYLIEELELPWYRKIFR